MVICNNINELLNQFGIILLDTSSVFSYSTTDPSFKIIISSAIDKTAGLREISNISTSFCLAAIN